MADRWLYAWALGSISFGGASLLVPLYIVQLGATPVHLGILASTATMIGAPGAILFGRFADHVEHRRTLVISTLGTVAVTLGGISLLSNITAIIVVNAALWLVVASIAPVLTMLIVDDAPESEWSERIGLLNKYQGYGWAGGLVLGAIWPFIGKSLLGGIGVNKELFWLLALSAGTSAVVAARTLPRPDPDLHVTSDRKVRRIAHLLLGSRGGIKGTTFAFSPNRLYWTTRKIEPRRLLGRVDRGMMTYLFAASLFFAGFAAFWAPLPLFLTNTGFGSGQIFVLYLVSSLGSAVLYQIAGWATTRYDIRLLQSGALATRGILFPIIAFITALGATWLEFVAAGVGLVAIGLTWAVIAVVGTSIVTRLAKPGTRGEVLGVYTALAAISGGIGGLLGGGVASLGYWIAFGVAGGLVILGAVLVFTIKTLSEIKGTPEPTIQPLTDPGRASGDDGRSPPVE